MQSIYLKGNKKNQLKYVWKNNLIKRKKKNFVPMSLQFKKNNKNIINKSKLKCNNFKEHKKSNLIL